MRMWSVWYEVPRPTYTDEVRREKVEGKGALASQANKIMDDAVGFVQHAEVVGDQTLAHVVILVRLLLHNC